MKNSQFASLFDRILELLLWVVLAWLPFAYGGVLPISHLLLSVVAGIALLVLGVRLSVGGSGVFTAAAPWAYVGIGLFVLLVAMQGSPTFGDFWSKNSEIWAGMTGAPPLLAPLSAPLTLNPEATASDFRMILGVSGLFLVAVHVLSQVGALRRLLVVLTVVGGGVAAVALLMQATGTDSLLWLRKGLVAQPTAGPFVHYGHFSQFVNLCLGAALGLLLMRLAEREARREFVPGDLVADLGAPDRRLDVLCLGVLVLGVVAVALSRSRNGVVSMLVGAAAAGWLLHRTRVVRGGGWPMLGLLAVALVVLMVWGFDPVYERLQTLGEDDVYNFRLAIAADAWRAFGEFPLFGAGQGAFDAVFPMFDSSLRPGRAEHAENQYLELLVETGLAGFGALTVVGVAIGVPWLKRLRAVRTPGDVALFGLVLGVVAVLVHATSDFGLRIPAVAVTMAVCLAAVVGQTGRPVGVAGARALGVLAVVLAVVLGAELPTLWGEHQAQRHLEAARAVAAQWSKAETDEQRLAVAVAERQHLAAAIEATPQRGELQVAYATAVWRCVELTEDLRAAADAADADLEGRRAREREAAALVQSALLEARRLAPVRGDLWSLVGQLGVEVLGQQDSAVWVQRGYRLAPENPNVVLAWGRQLLRQGDTGTALGVLTRAIRLGADAGAVIETVAVEFGYGPLAEELVAADLRWQNALVQRLRGRPELAGVVERVRGRLYAGLQQVCASEAAAGWELAALADLEAAAGRGAEAVGLYRRYLQRSPTSGARFALARLLKEQGDADGARQELRRLLNTQPAHAAAKRMLAELGG
ncbi:MAG: hypothetical protein RL398_3387 [Planctomycetota bacterium]